MSTEPRSRKQPEAEPDPRRRQEESIDSADLFRGARELVIRHNQDRYVLRITRQGKLILNK